MSIWYLISYPLKSIKTEKKKKGKKIK